VVDYEAIAAPRRRDAEIIRGDGGVTILINPMPDPRMMRRQRIEFAAIMIATFFSTAAAAGIVKRQFLTPEHDLWLIAAVAVIISVVGAFAFVRLLMAELTTRHYEMQATPEGVAIESVGIFGRQWQALRREHIRVVRVEGKERLRDRNGNHVIAPGVILIGTNRPWWAQTRSLTCRLSHLPAEDIGQIAEALREGLGLQTSTPTRPLPTNSGKHDQDL
jgi:hypothetical protein